MKETSRNQNNTGTQPASKADMLKWLPTNEEMNALLEKESDRGVILILAAYIEEILGLIISDACVSPTNAVTLLRHGEPAGTFGARLLIAEAFGFIQDAEATGLKKLQKIRNKAAHFERNGRGFDVLFDSASTVDHVVALADLFGYEKPQREPVILRKLFIDVIQTLAFSLLIRRMNMQPAQPAKTISELANELLEEYNDKNLNIKAKFPDNTLHSELASANVLYVLGLALQDMRHGKSIEDIQNTLSYGNKPAITIQLTNTDAQP
ncbi:hypothetical protein GO988_15905 [Hymenobacter sp. HMF4947]|uniref:DUF4145 domain-containing protein n=1 Tax=Hymenobacter ginkgonis TaxID=2682976 RepID=A0A7K1THN1_9BACT|nr:hypothetical protein [Hymenobacter ginkgonis]MVN77816.1 hypothetical protein [Hymenobacter ginkgonis]